MFESLVHLTDQENGFLSKSFDFFSRRPGSSIYALYLMAMVVLATNRYLDGIYHYNAIIVHLAILFLIVYAEQKWVREKSLPATMHHYVLIKKFWHFGFFGGVFAGTVNIFLVGFIQFLPFNRIDINFIFLVLAFVIAAVVMMVLLVTSFYKIMNEDPKTQRIFRLFSSPSQISMLSAYLFAGLSIPALLFQEMIRFTVMTRFHEPFQGLYNGTDPAVQIQILPSWKGEMVFLYLLPILMALSGEIGQFLIKDGRIFIPGQKFLQVIGKKVVTAVFITIIIFLIFDFNTHPLISHGVSIFIMGVILFRMQPSQEYCPRCNFSFIREFQNFDSNACYNCDYNETYVVPVKLPNLRQVLLPQCPSCGKVWDEPSRQCSNCKYTLILACPDCGNTLNPLWQTCAHCKNPVVSIPQRALSTKGFAGFQKALMDFLLVVLMLGMITVYFGATETVLLNTILEAERSAGFAEDLLIQSIIIAFGLLIGLLGFVSAVFLFSSGSRENNFPIFLVSSKIMSATGTILLVYVLLGILFLFPGISFFIILGKFFAFLFLGYYLFSKWKGLKEFTPQVSIDWEVTT